jgi:DNA-directed RNA polymerase specialized sigma24 family protein
MDTPNGDRPLEALLENHGDFLRDLERRVGERALAEDILQDALAKSSHAPSTRLRMRQGSV